MRLVLEEDALSDLQDIFNWIAKDNPAAAQRLVNRISVSSNCASPRGSLEWAASVSMPGPTPLHHRLRSSRAARRNRRARRLSWRTKPALSELCKRPRRFPKQ